MSITSVSSESQPVVTTTPVADATPTDSASLMHRPRRLRRTAGLRRMVRETVLTAADFIYPLFVMEGEGLKEAIPSMPDCYRYSLDLLLEEAKVARDLGIGAIALFPLPDEQKDNATESYNPNGLIPRAVRSDMQCELLKPT